jgi:hypothetical protein
MIYLTSFIAENDTVYHFFYDNVDISSVVYHGCDKKNVCSDIYARLNYETHEETVIPVFEYSDIIFHYVRNDDCAYDILKEIIFSKIIERIC